MNHFFRTVVPWGRAGVGAAEKPRCDNTHAITPFTYTWSAQVYVYILVRKILDAKVPL